jgi:hypothetical protein
MSARELMEWIAYDALEPIGETRADVRSAIIAATIANCHRDHKKPPFQLHEFMPFQERPKPSPAEVLMQMRAQMSGKAARRG